MRASDADRAESRPNAWSRLEPGARVTVVKLAPDGSEAARYPGEVAAVDDPTPWVAVQATWTYRTVELDGLTFRLGDLLTEWFSPHHWFNVFAIATSEGQFRGWYANVSYPARLDDVAESPRLLWHDLYVDLVGLPDGAFTMRDDDELLASGLDLLDPDLHARVTTARAEVIRRFTHQLPPFGDDAERRARLAAARRSAARP